MLRFRAITVVLGIFLFCTVPAQAQLTGSVTGRVLDQTGASLPGVSIELVAGTTELTAVSDDAGAYRFEQCPGRDVGADLPAPQLHRAAAHGVHRERPGRGRGRHVDAVVERRRSGHGHVHISQYCRCRKPGGEPRRHRVRGEPGRHHRRATRSTAPDARRRGARDRARPDHQPAQRRGESQPVLPARVQPGSRDRLREHGGGRAGEHADRRACPRLLRHQLPHPRAGQRRAVQERACTSPTKATSPRPAPPTSTTSISSTGRSCA